MALNNRKSNNSANNNANPSLEKVLINQNIKVVERKVSECLIARELEPEVILAKKSIKKSIEGKNSATIALIGKTGTGKSTLCNAFFNGPTFDEK